MSTVPHESVNWTPYQPPQPQSSTVEPAGGWRPYEAKPQAADSQAEQPAAEVSTPRTPEEIAAIRAKQTIVHSGGHMATGTMVELAATPEPSEKQPRTAIAETIDSGFQRKVARGNMVPVKDYKQIRIASMGSKRAAAREAAKQQPQHEVAPLSVLTFDQYQTAEKQPFPNTLVSDLMTSSLKINEGKKASGTKAYFDLVPTDNSDELLASEPESVIALRDQLTDFVSDKLKIVTQPGAMTEAEVSHLQAKKQEFVAKIQGDKEIIAANIRELYRGESPDLAKSEIGFEGFDVQTSEGAIDLLKTGAGLKNIRSNIAMQREEGTLFVHYTSEKRGAEIDAGQTNELARRIYLNPKSEDSVKLFRALVDQAEAAGISMQGKVWDRTSELLDDRAKQANEAGVRADGIVLYADQDADALLGLVENLYNANPDSFAGRQSAKMTLPIAEGIGVGSEPPKIEGQKRESLTSHRVKIIDQAIAETYSLTDSLSLSSEQTTSTFRTVFEQLCVENNVNPKNIAFNL
jgi:hypothetical protein